MRRLVAVLVAVLLAVATTSCGGKQVTNRQVATVAIGAGLVVIVVAAMALSASCNNCDNN